MRLIDADRIVYSWQIDADGQEHDGVTLQSIIKKMPTIKPEQKKGRWIYGHGDVKCSVCGHTINDPYYVEDYCTKCGSYNGATWMPLPEPYTEDDE